MQLDTKYPKQSNDQIFLDDQMKSKLSQGLTEQILRSLTNRVIKEIINANIQQNIYKYSKLAS